MASAHGGRSLSVRVGSSGIPAGHTNWCGPHGAGPGSRGVRPTARVRLMSDDSDSEDDEAGMPALLNAESSGDESGDEDEPPRPKPAKPKPQAQPQSSATQAAPAVPGPVPVSPHVLKRAIELTKRSTEVMSNVRDLLAVAEQDRESQAPEAVKKAIEDAKDIMCAPRVSSPFTTRARPDPREQSLPGKRPHLRTPRRSHLKLFVETHERSVASPAARGCRVLRGHAGGPCPAPYACSPVSRPPA